MHISRKRFIILRRKNGIDEKEKNSEHTRKICIVISQIHYIYMYNFYVTSVNSIRYYAIGFRTCTLVWRVVSVPHDP